MTTIRELVELMKLQPKEMKFADIKRVCDYYFGDCRIHGSHYVYKTPWKGDPRINIQNRNGKVTGYQVRQVLKAIEKKEVEDE